jgi:predicted transcriptional regulator
MSRSKHSEVQIITALKQVEAGRTVEDVAREVGVSAATIYGHRRAPPERLGGHAGRRQQQNTGNLGCWYFHENDFYLSM